MSGRSSILPVSFIRRTKEKSNGMSAPSATPAERQSAYRKARAELDGLIDVPVPGAEQLERSIARQLEA